MKEVNSIVNDEESVRIEADATGSVGISPAVYHKSIYWGLCDPLKIEKMHSLLSPAFYTFTIKISPAFYKILLNILDYQIFIVSAKCRNMKINAN